MSIRSHSLWLALTFLSACWSAAAAPPRNQALDREFQAAVAQYEAGKFPEAAEQLEKLLPAAPESFELHELLGLVYAAQSQDAKANEHLETAVHLKPDSAPARTALGSNLLRLGKPDLAEEQFKKAAALEPRSFTTSHNLGEFYVQAGKLAQAIPFLERAQRLKPSSYDNGYDLSLAYLLTGRTADARTLVHDLLKRKDTAELHNLLGQIEEKDGNFIVAVNELELAAHKDPSESYLFDWGCELLLHRTLQPAIEVFQRATARYPDSARLALGLGMALYSHGNYEEAVKALIRGADLNPRDARCYFFLSRAFDSSPSQAEAVIERFRRFTELDPNNGRGVYYYALSLWKGKRTQDPDLDLGQIEALLKRSIALDPNLAEAHQQLGNLYSDQGKFADAIPKYVRAKELNPDLADVYYRLGQAYTRTGAKDRAQEQFVVYQKLRQQHMADLDKQRAEIRQFVYEEQNAAPPKP